MFKRLSQQILQTGCVAWRDRRKRTWEGVSMNISVARSQPMVSTKSARI